MISNVCENKCGYFYVFIINEMFKQFSNKKFHKFSQMFFHKYLYRENIDLLIKINFVCKTLSNYLKEKFNVRKVNGDALFFSSF